MGGAAVGAGVIRWEWDAGKAAANVRNHGVSFELAVQAINDPFSDSWPDEHPDGNRWRTTGRPVASGYLVLVVIHTLPVLLNGGLAGRIISARAATRPERRRYEEG